MNFGFLAEEDVTVLEQGRFLIFSGGIGGRLAVAI